MFVNITWIWLSAESDHLRNLVLTVLQTKISSSPGHNRPVCGTVCSKMTKEEFLELIC